MQQIIPAALRNPAALPAGLRLYVVGDIHGRNDLLDRMLALILVDSRRSRATRRQIVFLGDYVDRGPQSQAVIERLRRGPPAVPQWSGFRWLCLRGNHEDAFWRFVVAGENGGGWLRNGGAATVADYLQRPPLAWPGHQDDLRRALRAAVPAAHLDFIGGLPLSHQIGGYFLVHAGIRPGIPLSRQSPDDLLWIRNDFLDSTQNHGRIVVHGHTITTEPDVRPNRIGIDTGAFDSGHLTALVAEGGQIQFLST